MARPINRRGFLYTTGFAVSPTLASAAANSQIIDTHIHIYDPTRPQGVPWPPKDNMLLYRRTMPDGYAALARPLGVTGTVVVEASAWVEDNQWVLDLAKDNPIIVGLVGHLEAEGFATNLERFRKNPLFRGVRLNGGTIAKWFAGASLSDNFKRLADADLSLDAIGDCGMIPTLLAVTEKVRSLRVIINHMPGEPTGWAADASRRAALRELASRPQVYAKVSGVLKQEGGVVPETVQAYKPALDEIWEMFGADRVVYGSNWPVSNRLAPYPTVLNVVRQYVADKGPDAAEKYFWRNSKACYKWPSRS